MKTKLTMFAKRLLAVGLVLPLLAFYPAWGQKEPSGEAPVLVFDAARLFERSKVGRSIARKTEKLQSDLSDEVDATRTALESDAKRLEEQRSVLPQERLRERAEELRLRQLTKEREISAQLRAIQAGQQRAQLDVLEEVYEVVGNLVEEYEAQLVLERNVLYYYDEGLDITDELIRRLNKRITTVDVTPIEASEN